MQIDFAPIGPFAVGGRAYLNKCTGGERGEGYAAKVAREMFLLRWDYPLRKRGYQRAIRCGEGRENVVEI